jgi:hypothetical protein
MFKLESISTIYSEPYKQRKEALSHTFYCTNTYNASPGKSITLSVDPTNEAYLKVMRFFQEKGLHVRISNRTFRIATKFDLENAKIHVDNYHFHVIISLTPHHDQMEDYEQVFQSINPYFNEPIDFLRQKFDLEYSKRVSPIIDNVRCMENFECILKEPFTFNKAIIVNSTYLHYPSNPHFGNTMEDGRLVEILTVDLISMIPPSLNFRYLWYYETIFEDEIIDSLYQHIIELYDNYKTETNNASSFQTNHLIEFNNGILQKCIDVYLTYIIQNTPDLKYLLDHLSEEKNVKKITIDTIEACVHPQYTSIGWFCDIKSKSTFIAFIHLNDNSTGLSIVDHFSNNTYTIPGKKNSLFIAPNSWLYPIRQTCVFEGTKLFLKIYITLHTE